MNSKSDRLLKRFEFQKVKYEGKRHTGRFILVDFIKNPFQYNRLGITVTRKFGNAVERNRFKRIVRVAFQECKGKIPEGYDLVVRPRRAAVEATSNAITEDLLNLGLNFLDSQ